MKRTTARRIAAASAVVATLLSIGGVLLLVVQPGTFATPLGVAWLCFAGVWVGAAFMWHGVSES